MLILVHDPDARAFAPETIVTVFGLPPATARLVSALAQGDDAVAYGKRHGLSYDTVRYHLKTAFARTGARSQARLLQLITRALDRHRSAPLTKPPRRSPPLWRCDVRAMLSLPTAGALGCLRRQFGVLGACRRKMGTASTAGRR